MTEQDERIRVFIERNTPKDVLILTRGQRIAPEPPITPVNGTEGEGEETDRGELKSGTEGIVEGKNQ